ncbi:MAG: DUF4331 domain-containing protein [Chloroflexi bacterium]|nr:DUF4331 domain-containing protein [Chloroflexota bacterium]MBV9898967.1 DUF4331 domain-containing protein [Chloroflexota bacterium]
MKRKVTLAASLAAVAALLVTPFTSNASSHREAPAISNDPYADLTDVYAFVASDKPDYVTLIMNAIPYENPMGGPNYYQFDPKVRYQLHIAQAGHNTADITYSVEFQTTVKNPNTFLYQTGPYAKFDDPNLNVQQTATVTKSVKGVGDTVIGTNLPVQPVNIGPHSNPAQIGGQDTTNNAGGISGGPEISAMMNGEGWFFAGQRGDPFFLDLGVFDLLALRPFDSLHKVVQLPNTDGVNSFAGYNVHTIAFQVPITNLTTDGQAAKADGSNSIIGVWATTSRQQTRVLSANGTGDNQSGDWVQIERLGNPLVNEVVVPLGAKDHFNATPPSGDAEFLPAVQNPELPGLINALYGVPVPPAPRNDLVTIFLTGIPGLNQPANVQASEMLRLNMGIAPTAPVGKGNRMGVLGGDNAGFPNGRRPEDDVVDIAIQAMAGATPLTPDFNKSPNNLLGDGVNQSAQPFNAAFPYLSQPYQGFARAGGTATSPTGAP